MERGVQDPLFYTYNRSFTMGGSLAVSCAKLNLVNMEKL